MNRASAVSKTARKAVTFRIQPDVEKMLSLACAATGLSEATIINAALLDGWPSAVKRLQDSQLAASQELSSMLPTKEAILAKNKGTIAAPMISAQKNPAKPNGSTP